MKLKSLSWIFCSSFLLAACGSSSPDNYIEKTTKLSCKYLKKCEESMWNEAGYDNVGDCVDQTLDAEIPVVGGTVRDAFVDSCSDFDSSAARKCLAGLRKAKRKCDLDAASSEQETACAEVCGTPAASALFADPASLEAALELVDSMPVEDEDEEQDELE